MADTKFVQIRLENAGGPFTDGSFIPSNLHVEPGDTIVWFITRRLSPIVPAPRKTQEAKAMHVREEAEFVPDANTVLVFRDHTPLSSPRVYGKGGIAEAQVAAKAPPGVYHYSALVLTPAGEFHLDMR